MLDTPKFQIQLIMIFTILCKMFSDICIVMELVKETPEKTRSVVDCIRTQINIFEKSLVRKSTVMIQ